MGGGGKDGVGEDGVGEGGSGGTRGGGGVRLRRSHAGAAGVRDVVVAMRRGPLGRPIARGGEGDAVDKASVRARVKGEAGEGSTGAASALAAGSVGDVSISGTGGEGERAGDDSVGGAWGDLCGGASCTGSGDNSGLGSTSTNSGMM